MSELTLTYRHNPAGDDDFGTLMFDVRTDDFSGTGSFWVQWQDVVDLAKRLSVFPLAEPVLEEWGLSAPQGSFDVMLGLGIEPANTTGDLQVRVEIADDTDRWRRVRTTFTSHYPDVEAFARALPRVIDGTLEKAVLKGV